jgi:hypothetical protein
MKETKYLYPFTAVVGQGPHTSDCTKSKARELLSELEYKLLVCFPNSHASHTSFSLLAFSNKGGYNLPRRSCNYSRVSLLYPVLPSLETASADFTLGSPAAPDWSLISLYSCTIAEIVSSREGIFG